MRQRDGIIARQIHDSYFLIDTKQSYNNDKCSLYEINEIGYYIWNKLDYTRSIEDIAKSLLPLLAEEINYEELVSDIKEYLDMLIEVNFVEV